MLKFALKNTESERFKRWFPKNPDIATDLRRGSRNVYKEPFARTERLMKSPLFYMRRRLNRNLES